MALRYLGRSPAGENRTNFFVPIALLWAVVLSVVIGVVWVENDLGSTLEGFYIIPWTCLAAVCVLAPSAYLLYQGKFDMFHPLVFAAWSYVFPAYVVGSLIVAFGWVDRYFLSFIEDPHYNFPLTLIYISIGFLGMTAGFYLPVGKKLADWIEPRLPKWNWKPEQIWLPGILLLLSGVIFNIIGFLQGLIGYQRSIEISVFDGLFFFLMTLLTEGTVLLWLAIFSTREKNGAYWIVLVILLLFLPLRMAVLGSRSSLFVGLLPIAVAFLYSGRKLKFRTAVAFAVIGIAAMLIGVVYGTTFRKIKGSEARVTTGDYFGQVLATVEYLSDEDPRVIFEENAQTFADRVDNLSSVAVVVSNYEKLAPYEASYGLENNILNDLYTSFIPRFVWPDKPSTSDARAYSDLYFGYGDNSFAISPFGDLLRNFGPIGIPLGMMVLGFYLRFIYASLIDTPHPGMWKKVAYFTLLTIVSYESFYATTFPSVVRLVFVLAISLALVNLFTLRKPLAQ